MHDNDISKYYAEVSIPNDSQLFLVEGINGAGKSSFTRWITTRYSDAAPILTYRGKGVHPVDLLRTACFTEQELSLWIKLSMDALPLEKHNLFQERINQYVVQEHDIYLVPYLHVLDQIPHQKELMTKAFEKEIYDGHVSAKKYMHCIHDRWHSFARTEKTRSQECIHIFEAVTFQYPIMELLGFHNMDKAAILSFVNNLVTNMLDLRPVLFYIDVQDVANIIISTAKERPGWIHNYISWLSTTKIAKERNLDGLKGVIQFCEMRQEIERFIIDRLPITCIRIKRESTNDIISK